MTTATGELGTADPHLSSTTFDQGNTDSNQIENVMSQNNNDMSDISERVDFNEPLSPIGSQRTNRFNRDQEHSSENVVGVGQQNPSSQDNPIVIEEDEENSNNIHSDNQAADLNVDEPNKTQQNVPTSDTTIFET